MSLHHTGYPTYIPIIKWQKFEQRALQGIGAENYKEGIHPCIEVRTITQHKELMAGLGKCWPGPALIDYADPSGRLSNNRIAEFVAFLKHAGTRSYPLTPVIDPRDAESVKQQLLDHLEPFNRIALRSRLSEFSLQEEDLRLIGEAVASLIQPGRELQLILDLGVSPASWEPQDVDNFVLQLCELPWNSLAHVHLASGAFPLSLSEVTTAEFPRNDWKLWADVNTRAKGLRLGYSDYGVVSPRWSEDALGKGIPHAAIRYTRDSDWLVLRAGGSKKEDSIALSQILLTEYADSFKGEDYSLGDHEIWIRGQQGPMYNMRSGSNHISEGWIHHAAFVVKAQY